MVGAIGKADPNGRNPGGVGVEVLRDAGQADLADEGQELWQIDGSPVLRPFGCGQLQHVLVGQCRKAGAAVGGDGQREGCADGPDGAQVMTGVMIRPDFATFWSQAAQQGFAPQVVTIGKALLFPAWVDALGDRANGSTTQVWWGPDHPFASSLTGTTARQLADPYIAASGKPWMQTPGFNHAIHEVALDVVKRAADLSDPAAIVAAIAETDLQTIGGPVNWKAGPVKNVQRTPMVGGQWQRRDGVLELHVVDNSQKRLMVRWWSLTAFRWACRRARSWAFWARTGRARRRCST